MDLLINISTDSIHITDWQITKLIHRDDVENELWPTLITIYRHQKFQDVLVINGPGGFTNLRTWVLCLNLLNHLQKDSINFRDYSKLEILTMAVEQNFLPAHGAINIGQKKNCRLYSFREQKHTILAVGSVASHQDIFLDQVWNQDYWWENQNMVRFGLEQGRLVLEYQWKKIQPILPNKKSVKTLHAQYFVEAVIG